MFAADYCSMKMDLDERSRLHRLDTGAEEQLSPKELSRRAGARVGFKLPEVHTE